MKPPPANALDARPSRQPPRRTYKAAPERRAEIVDATIAIIAEQGLHAWKTAELARRVGVSEPTLFRHFRTKGEILTAAVRRETATIREMVSNYQGTGAAWEQAEGLVKRGLEFFEATGGGPLVILTGQVIRVSPTIRRDILRTITAVHGRLTELFATALAEAGNPPGVEPAHVADLAMAIVQSSGLRWIMSDRAFPIQARGRAMLGILKRAILGPGGEQ